MMSVCQSSKYVMYCNSALVLVDMYFYAYCRILLIRNTAISSACADVKRDTARLSQSILKDVQETEEAQFVRKEKSMA